LPITKAGDSYLRRILVQCAHCLLSRGKDCDLKRFGERLLQRGGGRGARRKVITAVARKLAVLLHALLRSGADFDPDYLLRRAKTA
jgi:transposase